MDKKTLTLIGVAGLGLAALYIWSKSKQKNFANLRGPGPQSLPYATVTAGPNTGQVVFFGPRGVVYLPAGTIPFQEGSYWYFQSGQEMYPLTGPGALTSQFSINQVI